MNSKRWFLFAVLTVSLFSSACATTVNPASQTSPSTTLQEWRRSYLPTRLG
jgi:hypothetical protein